jgi:AbiU2/Schlafen, AlbA_2
MSTSIEIHGTARVISIDLDLAVAFYETFFPSGQDAKLIARVNTGDFYPAFNVVSDSLHRNAIMALCRIWDTQPDSANLNSLAKMFGNNQVLANLARAGHAVVPKQMKKWQADVAKVKDSDELQALMDGARHRALAHTASPNKAYKGKARVAMYGDERRVMEWSIPVVERANAFIGYSYARSRQQGIRFVNQNLDLGDLLAEPRETLDIEIKDWLDLSSNNHKALIAKEIIALANHGGGYLLVGFVELADGSFKPALSRPPNLNAWSQDTIQSIVSKYVDPAVQCRVVHQIAPTSSDRYPISLCQEAIAYWYAQRAGRLMASSCLTAFTRGARVLQVRSQELPKNGIDCLSAFSRTGRRNSSRRCAPLWPA